MGYGIKRVIAFLTLILFFWLLFQLLLPLFSPFLLGLLLALAADPMVNFLQGRLRIPRPVSAGLGVTIAFFFLGLILLLILAFLVREMKSLSGVLPDLESAARSGLSLLKEKLLALSALAPRSLQPLLQENTAALFSDGTALVGRIIGYLLSLAGNLLSHLPDSALGLGTAAISGFMISAKLPSMRKWLLLRFPKDRLKPVLSALNRIKSAVFGWFAAQCKLMGMTYCILLVGLLLLRIPKATLWALAVAAVDALPVFGTGTILIPWSVICFLQNDGGRGIGLLGLYAVISLVRSAMEPRLLGRHLGLDPLVTLMAMYAGFKLWGIGGMIFSPLLVVTAMQLMPERKT